MPNVTRQRIPDRLRPVFTGNVGMEFIYSSFKIGVKYCNMSICVKKLFRNSLKQLSFRRGAASDLVRENVPDRGSSIKKKTSDQASVCIQREELECV